MPAPELATVRRFEAAGFRAWPAASSRYDGSWLVRLTPGHPAKRLNSVNPLDRRDTASLPERVERARQLFAVVGRPVTFRMSPLAGEGLSAFLDNEGWARFSPSLVMGTALDEAATADALDHIPLKDVARFTAALVRVQRSDPALQEGLAALLGAVEPETGLFVLERGDEPLAAAVCVHDGELAGLFEVATAEGERGRGHGRRIVRSALKWARGRGARRAWLQVEADNAAALGLYGSLGFRELYRYHYRRPGGP